MVSVFSFSFALPFSFSLSFFLSLLLFLSLFLFFFLFTESSRIESNRIESNREEKLRGVVDDAMRRWTEKLNAREREIESGHDVHLVEYEQHWRACTAIG